MIRSSNDRRQTNQGVDGDVPVVVPNGDPGQGSCNDIAWTSAFPQITEMLHSYHADKRIVQVLLSPPYVPCPAAVLSCCPACCLRSPVRPLPASALPPPPRPCVLPPVCCPVLSTVIL